jgi:SAM-dependent methyltransferase
VAEVVESLANLNASDYLAFNPDVAAGGLTAEDHLVRYGFGEGRRQFSRSGKIARLRRNKLESISFQRDPEVRTVEGQLDFLSEDERNDFGISETPPVAGNDYNQELVDLIRANPDKLFLDIGAGLRYTYYSNVVNTEIWRAASTDVICVGENLPFSDSQFDYVFCLAVLEHAKRPWVVAREITRVVKPHGEIRIDYPFLQPVHGYPYHFFNATPLGHMSLFEDHFDILSCQVRPWQHPIFTLSWLLNEWLAGLPEGDHADFGDIKIIDLLGAGQSHLDRPFCSHLSPAAQNIIAAGTTLIARRR